MILVSGATGLIGRHLLRQLGEAGTPARAFVRDPARGEALGCEFVVGDFDRPDSVAAALAGVDRLFLNTSAGPSLVRQQTDAIDAARAAGVRQIVKVSVQDAAPTAGLARGWHGEIEEHLRRSGVPWAVLRPNGFMQNFLGDAADIAEGGQFFGAYGDGAIAHVDCRDIAGCAAALLTRPIGDDETFVLTGPEGLTHDDIAARFSATLGRHIRYVDLTPEAMSGRLIDRYGLPAGMATEAVETMAYLASGAWGSPTTAVADLTGRAPHTFDDFLADHIDAFRPPVTGN
ncbi:NmrA family NAD(P)-binding protein [Micromonospora sp. NEAU-HG-1]|nr:NmrA family NAD(P)-binding protein [Micromonospora rubida]